MYGWASVDNIREMEILEQQLLLFARVCITVGGGGSGYCGAGSQLCCPWFPLPDSLWRQNLRSGSRISVLRLRLWGIGGLHERWSHPGRLWRMGCCQIAAPQTNVWVRALTQPKELFKNQRQIFRNWGKNAFVGLFFFFKRLELPDNCSSNEPAWVSCSVSCSFLKSRIYPSEANSCQGQGSGRFWMHLSWVSGCKSCREGPRDMNLFNYKSTKNRVTTTLISGKT